jgi:hypothetical protein
MMNINELIIQYDQLKLKRSNMTQRDSLLSGQKSLHSDCGSSTQFGMIATPTLPISKCVPKSKATIATSAMPMPPEIHTSLSNEKGQMTYHEARFRYFKDRKGNNNNSESMLRMEETNDCSRSVMVAPVGLNLTLLAKKKKETGRGSINGEKGVLPNIRVVCESHKSKYRLTQRRGLR